MNKTNLILAVILLSCSTIFAQEQWPVLKHYDQDHLLNISLPLGGIGTGTVGLGGRGELRDWSIMNRLAIGLETTCGYRQRNQEPFFAIYVKPEGQAPETRALIGPVHSSEFQDGGGTPTNHHGLSRFSSASFDAAYPFGQVNLSDKSLPVTVKIKGFNPLIPGDAASSGIPIAVLRYEVTNTTNAPMEVAVCGTMRNFIGRDTESKRPKKNINTFREGQLVRGIMMNSEGVDAKDPAWGTMALTTIENENISYRLSSINDAGWCRAILDFWDDFSADGTLTDKDKLYDDDPMASLATKKTIPANSTKTFTFYITWHFPNRQTWNFKEWIGNYYTTVYSDAWDVLEKEAAKIPALEKKSIEFISTFIHSDLPEVVKEAALFNLTALRSQTTMRIPSGHLMGWEGAFNNPPGGGWGSSTHVWNYETATSFLFGDLAHTMRDIEFNYALDSTGLMCFRAVLPLSKANEWKRAAADGQMGTILRFYRDYLLSGDRQFLENHWEKVKSALSFAWIKGGWDADQDGVMEGCQHNTMDVEYYGPNPQMGFWYLGALRACEEMAKAMKDKAFEKKCHTLFTNGSQWIDANLFNGEYYIQKIMPPKSRDDIAPSLIIGMGSKDVTQPIYQLGEGCLVDQLVGQQMAHLLGLGYLANPRNIEQAYLSIMKYNYVADFTPLFNNMLSFAMGEEAGLILSGWPKGRLEVPFPYFAELGTGYEYVAAIGMLYEGQTENGLKCIKNIRDRFDGEKRNPFDEPEYGHFYSRAMASWSSAIALSGFHYSGIDKSMEFTAKPGTYFWSNGYSWGSCKVENNVVQLQVLKGSLSLNKFRLSDGKEAKLKNLTINEGETQIITIK
jgi:uncharacterized protein (DUF608 family)